MCIPIMPISFTFDQSPVKLIITDRVQIAQSWKSGGFISEKLDLSYQNRVLTQDVGRLVSPFRNRTETSRWQSEFWGKWFTSAVLAYRYKPTPQLRKKQDSAIDGLIATQTPEGYIGNYAEDMRLEAWDTRGRKYCMLCSLTYDFTESNHALQAHPKPVAPNTCSTYVKRVDEHDRLWLAVDRFRTTHEQAFHEDFLNRFAQFGSLYPLAPISTQTIRDYNLHETLISYCFIMDGASKTVQEKILSGLRADCDRMVAVSFSEGYGNILIAENWKQRHTIGNALQMAWKLAMASELTGQPSYREVALRQLPFILGANPLGKVFVTGVGSTPVRNPHYRPFSIHQQAPPGLTVKGPTIDAQFLLSTYMLSRYKGSTPTPEKSYVDIVGAHCCNEPDIEIQAHLIGMSAYFYATSQ